MILCFVNTPKAIQVESFSNLFPRGFATAVVLVLSWPVLSSTHSDAQPPQHLQYSLHRSSLHRRSSLSGSGLLRLSGVGHTATVNRRSHRDMLTCRWRGGRGGGSIIAILDCCVSGVNHTASVSRRGHRHTCGVFYLLELSTTQGNWLRHFCALLSKVIFGYYFGTFMPILDFCKVTLVIHIGTLVPYLR
jgi:hypothetical protein